MRNFTKNSLTYLILEKLVEAGEITFDIFFPPQYSYTRFSRKLFGVDSHLSVSPRTVSSILSRLKRQGLVVRKGRKRSSRWNITKYGRQRFEESLVELPEPDGINRLVIFDIPERERRKRDRIRIELVACNFRKLQKSVWIGQNPLPEDFISLLDDLRLKDKVHIFSVLESGTMEEE